MTYDTDVLIVGAGPTGLMLACQLKRFNIPFQIIEIQTDRTHESRAFGIQARSMEIFQNLRISKAFLDRAQPGWHVEFNIKGKPCLRFDIDKLAIEGTPFPTIYFLPQSETEEILIDHLREQKIEIQRNMELSSFVQTPSGVTAEISNTQTLENKTIHSRYIVGCDGAHSKVRKILNIQFEGASYKQEFLLADCEVEWVYPKGDYTFRMFVEKQGIFGVIPLPHHLDRVLAARVNANQNDTSIPTTQEVQTLGEEVTHHHMRINNMIWSSRFHLHHRAVADYQVGRAFIAGDAAHIHTPVGGQGMNTGLQDVTNLAWKLAFVIQYGADENLLATYQAERHAIGEKLVHTTDKVFGLMTSQNIFIRFFRLNILPYVMKMVNRSTRLKKRFFTFMSQLRIHYHTNNFVTEITTNADKKFLKTLGAGYRAPDAPYQNTTLFEKFAEFPCHLLLFTNKETLTSLQEQQLEELEKLNNKIIRTLTIKHNSETQIIFDRYGVSNAALYFIRPDGYIAFRSYGLEVDAFCKFMNKLVTH